MDIQQLQDLHLGKLQIVEQRKDCMINSQNCFGNLGELHGISMTISFQRSSCVEGPNTPFE